MEFGFENVHYKLSSEFMFGSRRLKNVFFTQAKTKLFLFPKENLIIKHITQRCNFPCVQLIKRNAMKTYGGEEV
jgi:hypothetical protein